jgi:WD40 repeat protein
MVCRFRRSFGTSLVVANICVLGLLVDFVVVVYTPLPGKSWNTLDVERDTSRSFLRGHVADVYDLCWSPDSTCLVSGAVDRLAIVWDVASSKSVQQMKDHANFVQGVAWDPLNKYIATEGCDRSCRVYSRATKKTGAPFKAVPQVRRRVFVRCMVFAR